MDRFDYSSYYVLMCESNRICPSLASRGGSRISQTRGHRLANVYCGVTVMKSDVTVCFSIAVVRRNVHPVTGILLDLLESEVLETIYLLRGLSKRPPGPFVPMPGSAYVILFDICYLRATSS